MADGIVQQCNHTVQPVHGRGYSHPLLAEQDWQVRWSPSEDINGSSPSPRLGPCMTNNSVTFVFFFVSRKKRKEKKPFINTIKHFHVDVFGALFTIKFFFFPGSSRLDQVLASAPLHTQETEIGLGALVWQPQPSFSISGRSCLMAEKSRQNASRIARQKMKTGCERHGERESERRREDRATKLGRTRKTIRCYQSE